MNDVRFFEREFELRYLKSQGNAFQDLFVEMMERAYPRDFQRVRAYGKSGDFKCDGYHASRRTVFQVYAPEKMSLGPLLQKIHDDYAGAVQLWAGRMDCWVFVHNSRAGLPPQAVQAFDDLRNQSGSPRVEVWGYEELRQVLHQIGLDEARTLFPAPSVHIGTRPEQRLPQPDSVERYWAWLAGGSADQFAVPHLTGLQTLDLGIRLLTPQQVQELRVRDEQAVARHAKNTTWWTMAEDDGSFAERASLRITDLSHILRAHRHVLIVGDSGSGKSRLLRRFAMREAGRLQSSTLARAHRQTPVLVELWRFGPDRTLLDLIAGSVRRSGADIARDELLTAVDRGYVVLLIDGLDEVPLAQGRECLAQIVDLIEQYPKARIVLATRPFPEPPNQFYQLAIAPLSDADLASALRAHFGSGPAFHERLGYHTPKDYVRLHLQPDIRQLCRRPLTLGLVLTLLSNNASLPETLYGVYDRILSVLLDWEVRRARLPSPVTAAAALEETAYITVELDRISLPTVDWLRTAGRAVDELRATSVAAGPSAEEILRLILSTGLLRDLGGEVCFTHTSFLEFLAARRILRASTPAYADPVALHTGVARFLCGGMQDATPLLEEHLLLCDDVQAMMPLLGEASLSRCVVGRFEALYHAIGCGQDLAIDLTYSLRGPEADAFAERVDEFVQTCIAFKPKALSILKGAADGVVRATPWDQSRSWFDQIVAGLEVYDWPGATLHRRLSKMGFFEAVNAFVDDGTDPGTRQAVESLFAYLDAIYEDNFAAASRHLAQVDKALCNWHGR